MDYAIKRIEAIKYYIKEYGIDGCLKCLVFSRAGKLLFHKVRIFKLNLKRHNESIYIRSGSTDKELMDSIIKEKEYDWIWDYKILQNKAIIIDGGANIGDFSLICAHYYPEAMILAIEPEDDNFKMLKMNCGGKKKNVFCIKSGLWIKDTYLSVKNIGNGEWGWTVEADANGTVIGRSIPSLIKEYNLKHIDLMKIDIEGSEVEILMNNDIEWLNMVEILVVEFHEWIRPGSEETNGKERLFV